MLQFQTKDNCQRKHVDSKQLSTTQTLFFLLYRDEERMGSSFQLEMGPVSTTHSSAHQKEKNPSGSQFYGALGHRGVVPDSDPLDQQALPVFDAPVVFHLTTDWGGLDILLDSERMRERLHHDSPWNLVGLQLTAIVNRLRHSIFWLTSAFRRLSFGEEGITDVFMTTGKTLCTV